MTAHDMRFRVNRGEVVTYAKLMKEIKWMKKGQAMRIRCLKER